MGKAKKPKKPRKLSAYNKFVKKHRLAGKSMKQIGRMWKGKGSNPKPKSGGSRSSRSRSSSNTTGGRRLGKNTFNTQKIFGLLTKAALVAPAIVIATGSGDMQHKIREGLHSYTGYNMSTRAFNFEYAFNTYKPYIFMKIFGAVVPKITSFVKGLMG